MISLESLRSFQTTKNGFFRFKKFSPDLYLITNDIGKYAFLSFKDFELFIGGTLESGEKYEELISKGFIKSQKFDNEAAFRFLQKNHFVGFGPSLHIIVTTLRCNHACQYCHASVAGESDTNYDMTLETAQKVVDTIFYTNSHAITIEFQGGESLLNFSVVQFIISYAKEKAFYFKKQVYFSLVSNLTLMDDEKLEYFVKEGVGISTSLDGDEELHNFNRTYRKGNSYREVTTQIQKINTSYNTHGIQSKVGALLTVTKKTLPKYKEIVQAYLENGLDGIYLRPLNPYGFAEKKGEILGYSHEEFIDFYYKGLDYIIELNKSGIYFKEQYASMLLTKILTDTDPNFMDSRSPCGACIGQVAYNYDGKIFTCDEGRMFDRMGDDSFQIAQVSESPREVYTQMMEGDVAKIMVQASTLDGLPGYNDHVYKPYLGVCPISAYKATGSIVSNFPKDTRTKIDIAVLDYIFSKLQDEQTKAIFEKWIGNKSELDIIQC